MKYQQQKKSICTQGIGKINYRHLPQQLKLTNKKTYLIAFKFAPSLLP